MNCKNMTYFLILIFAVSSCAFSGCLEASPSDDSLNISDISDASTEPIMNSFSMSESVLDTMPDDNVVNIFSGTVRHENNTIAYSYEILAHNNTGACYLIIQQNSSLSMVPMVLENGQPYVYMTPYLLEERNVGIGEN